MATTVRERIRAGAGGNGGARRATPDPAVTRLAGTRDLAKFTGLVALLAIFADAAVGHALLWENDPYWTYWVTKTFLIATVFGLGTAWLGVGAGRGAVITAAHTLVLTVYYWSLSPIGLPSHPEWLDLEHTWVTGLPVHFGVIYLGYLAALWVWRRRDVAEEVDVAAEATRALVVALAVVVVGGGAASLAVGDFPGVTWFVVRLLLTVPFLLVWWAAAGRDRLAAVAGGVALAFVWGTYAHFLGPSGLPDLPLRIFEQAPPEASVGWLSYRESWLVAFPVVLVVAVAAMVAASTGRAPTTPASRPLGMAAALVALVGIGLGVLAWSENTNDGVEATVSADGAARVEVGPFYEGELRAATASIEMTAWERNPRVTPLPPHDDVDLTATVTHADGRTYEVRATEPMVDDPLGRHGTWWGVGLHRWHHGDSGIGTARIPAVRSEVAVFALGEVQVDGATVAAGVPVHVMTMGDDMPGRLELDVGTEGVAVPGLPDGHLRVVWADYDGGAGHGAERTRYALGGAVLVGLLALTGLALRLDRELAGA